MKHILLKKTLAIAAIAFLCPRISAQESVVLNNDKTHFIIGYSVGGVGYTSKKGISAWDVKGKKSGWSDNIRFMVCPKGKSISYGLLLNDNNSSKKYKTEGVKEKNDIVYAAPQVAYMKGKSGFPGNYGLIGAGVGYAHYRSRNKIAEGNNLNIKDSTVGMNIFAQYGISLFSKRCGAVLDANILYTPLNPSYKNAAALPMQARGKFSSVSMAAQIGIYYYL